jgi:hypothetical protein
MNSLPTQVGGLFVFYGGQNGSATQGAGWTLIRSAWLSTQVRRGG